MPRTSRGRVPSSCGRSTATVSPAATGSSARHAVEIGLWALKNDVTVRTVQDPETFRDLLYAVVTGQRNHEDSRRKGLASRGRT